MAEAQWPPRSPHEALLSSPSGRRKLRELQLPNSPSKSPLKNSISTPSFHERVRRLADPTSPLKNRGSDDEEDEEILQLQLQAIEKKLKLKRLQQAKSRGNEQPVHTQNEEVTSTADKVRETTQSRLEARKRLRREQASQAEIEVPLSPQRNTAKLEPKSPSRVLLGIDKGRRAAEVSLRRPPASPSKLSSTHAQGLSSRTGSQAGSIYSQASSRSDSHSRNSAKSFSERLGELRSTEISKEERRQKLQQLRTKSFQVDEAEINAYQKNASTFRSTRAPLQKEYSREEILRSIESVDSRARGATHKPLSGTSGSQTLSRSQSLRSSQPSTVSTKPSSQSAIPSEFEPFSTCHLSKRILPHAFLTRQLSERKVYLLPDLLREVKAPSFDPPDVETDWILFAIVASKSEPKNHKDDGSKNKEALKSKFMAITLTDLKWEVTLFLFGSAFEKWWKLSEGALIALLNPTIMPPPPHQIDTGRFSLTLNSADETLLEVGTARDLGWCKSTKRDGQLCHQWVDLRHTQFCEFHVNLQVQKTKASRMEVNTMTGGGNGGKGQFGSRRGAGAGRYNPNSGNGPSLSANRGQKYDRGSGSDIWVASQNPGHDQSVAHLFDNEDSYGAHRVGKEERLRRRLAEKEKEQDIARRLGQIGDGIGGEYLRTRAHELKDSNGLQPSPQLPNQTVDADQLGLKGGIASSIRLSPIKRKRGMGGQTAEPVGWGGAFKATTKQNPRGDEEYAKKKTRFVTSKGIREAGRESLGNTDLALQENGVDEDDLVIV